MPYLLLTWLALLPPIASASDAYESTNGVHVLQMDEDFPIEKIDDEAVTLHPLSELEGKSEILPLPVRNRLFDESGLAPLVKDWDAVQLDLLSLRCEKHEPRRVQEKYKNKLPLEAIETFQKLARKYRKERDRK